MRSLFITLVAAVVFAIAARSSLAQPIPDQYWAFIGNTSSDGIAVFKLDTNTGALTSAGIAAAARSPGFLAIAPNQKFLYSAVTMQSKTGNAASIQGFAIDAVAGRLSPINHQLAGGDGTAFVAVDPAGQNVLAANYGSATVAVLPIDSTGRLAPATGVIKETGSSIDPQRQTHAYAHSINCDPSGRFAISCDLGADKLFVYRFDSALGKLTPNDPPFTVVPAGSGPRHLTFSPDGKVVYAINEMGGTIIAFRFDSTAGTLKQIQVISTLKQPIKGNTSAEVQIDPTGKFLYASNRGSTNYLTIFSIDKPTGQITLVGYQDCLGDFPRNFRIDPTGKYLLLANQNSNTLVLFAIDLGTGKLTPVGRPIPTVHGPICVKFVAAVK